MEERKYFVKEGYRTNLDTMYTKVRLIAYDLELGEYNQVQLVGKTYDVDTIYEFLYELEQLSYVARGRVTGKEYGRIKAISEERDWMRYSTCIAEGMDESRAAYAFLS